MSDLYSSRIRWLIYGSAIVLSFLGLGLCKLVELLVFENGREMMRNPIWASAIYAVSAVFAITLLIAVPIEILVVERKTRRKKPPDKLTLADIAGIPLGAYNPNAEVPKWIAYPTLALFWFLLAALALGMVLAFVFHG